MGGVNNGADMIQPMRRSGERAFIACTVDLLEKGVDIERLNDRRFPPVSQIDDQVLPDGRARHPQSSKSAQAAREGQRLPQLLRKDFHCT
jgi:hypothetical protein